MTHPQQLPVAFAWPVRVYWEDTDAGGIVFYANYLKFFERARTEWLRSRGIEQHEMRTATGGMFVVSEVNVRYLQSARLDDELIVTATPLEIGRASMTIAQQVMIKTSTETAVLCEGTVRVGWVDGITYKPSRIPQTILDTLK